MPFPYTADANTITPSAAAGVSVTPAGSSWGNGSWVELIASTGSAIHLTSLHVHNPDAVAADYDVEFELGTGGAGAEVAFAAFPARQGNGLVGRGWTPLPFALNVPTGTRLAVRMRSDATATPTWKVSVGHIPAGASGTVYRTDADVVCVPAAADASLITTGTVAFANSAWTELEDSLPADAVLAFFAANVVRSGMAWEIDIGTGAAASEVVRTTLRGNNNTAVSNHAIDVIGVPLGSYASGTRIAWRVRCEATLATNVFFKLAYYAGALGAHVPADGYTTAAMSITPSAATETTVQTGSAGNYGNWVEFIASAGADLDFAGLTPHTGVATLLVQVGVGGAGAETAIATIPLITANNNANWRPPIIPLIDRIASGARVAIRAASGSATQNPTLTLSTLASYSGMGEDGDFKVLPNSTTRTAVAVNTTAWANSSWVEMSASLGEDIGVWGVEPDGAGVLAEYEVDIATGGSGSEVVAFTVRGGGGTGVDSAVILHNLSMLFQIAGGSRVACRVRKSGTSNQNWGIGLAYVGGPTFTGGGGATGQPRAKRWLWIPFGPHARQPRASVWG